jgi:hypothetical protein
MIKMGSLLRTPLQATISDKIVRAKRELPSAIVFTVGKRAYAVKLTPTMQMTATDRKDRLYEGRKNSDE